MRFAAFSLCFVVLSLPAQAQDSIVWEQVGNRPVNAYQLAFGDDGTLWAVSTSPNSTWRLNPGSSIWNDVSDNRHRVLPLGPDTLLTAKERSIDGGQTWTEVNPTGQGEAFELESGVLLSGNETDRRSVARSVDRGATWTELASADCVYGAFDFVSFPAGTVLPSGEMLDSERVIARCSQVLMYSDDQGLTWLYTSSPFGPYSDGGDIETTSNGRMWYGGCPKLSTINQLHLSEDSGQTWALIRDFTGTKYEYDCWGDLVSVPAQGNGPDALYHVMVGGEVFLTDDVGETWTALAPVPGGLGRDALLGPDGRLYVSTRVNPAGDGWVYRTVNPVPASGETLTLQHEHALSLTATPNPARDEVTLTLSLPEATSVHVVVYDALGRTVGAVHDGVLAAGTHALAWEARKLPPGTYLAVAATPDGRIMRRFTVVE